MTDEDRKLLLIDLCARLPYHVKVGFTKKDISPKRIINYNVCTQDLETEDEIQTGTCVSRYIFTITDYRPYLRPMSSMTKEEEAELKRLGVDNLGSEGLFSWATEARYGDFWFRIEDWLLSHHFDYRDLIKKGLALEATEEMYKID